MMNKEIDGSGGALPGSCRHCGKVTENGEIYCLPCQASLGAPKTGKIWLFAIFFSLLLLILAGMLLWQSNCCGLDLSWDRLTGKPAAVINGEEISRKELSNRLDIARRILERQYGQDVFSGAAGKDRLLSLKREVLNRILEERLIAQEARRLGIAISGEMVEQELQRIGKEMNVAREKLPTMLQEDGISQDALKSHIRHALVLQALARNVLSRANPVGPPEVYFATWLENTKKAAKVSFYDSSRERASIPTSRGACCGVDNGAAGGCGGGKAAGPVDEKTEKQAREAALTAYGKGNGKQENVRARVTDYGCHIQVDIDEKGKTVKSYTYRDGAVYEI